MGGFTAAPGEQRGNALEILSIDNYSVSYDGIKNTVDAVTLSVAQGEILSIVGESGSGKSTLLHGVLGLLPRGASTRGGMKLFGNEIARMDDKARRALCGSRVSMIFQDTGRYMNPIARIGAQYDEYLCIHGMKDFRIPYDQGMAAFNTAQMMGVPSKLIVFPEENHWILQPQNALFWHRSYFDWLERWCK